VGCEDSWATCLSGVEEIAHSEDPGPTECVEKDGKINEGLEGKGARPVGEVSLLATIGLGQAQTIHKNSISRMGRGKSLAPTM